MKKNVIVSSNLHYELKLEFKNKINKRFCWLIGAHNRKKR